MLFGGRDGFPRLQAVLMLCQYCGSFLGVTATGALRDLTGTYALPFGLSALLAAVSCVLCQMSFREPSTPLIGIR